MSTYTNKKINFQIQFLSSWTIKEEEGAYGEYIVYFSDDTRYSLVEILPKGGNGWGCEGDDCPEAESSEIVLDGYNAVRIDFGDMVMINLKNYPSSWNEDNRIEIKGYSKNKELVNGIINSIKLIQ